MNLTKKIPINTAIIPVTNVIVVYKRKLRKSPDFKNTWFSYANVEKVVRPPQNPVVINKSWLLLSDSCFTANPKITPINRLPIMFAAKVSYGIPVSDEFRNLLIK